MENPVLENIGFDPCGLKATYILTSLFSLDLILYETEGICKFMKLATYWQHIGNILATISAILCYLMESHAKYELLKYHL